jgi:SAM-dependent methyltransferase
MIIFWIIFILLFLSFGVIVFVGAPYVPSHQRDIKKLFDELNLRKGSTVVDLGCGDGKVLVEASRHGLKAIGYELNPFLYLIAKFRLRKYPKAKVVFANYWAADVSRADLVFIFSAAPFMDRLYKKLKNEIKPGGMVASYAFSFEGIKIYKKIEPVNIYKF